MVQIRCLRCAASGNVAMAQQGCRPCIVSIDELIPVASFG